LIGRGSQTIPAASLDESEKEGLSVDATSRHPQLAVTVNLLSITRLVFRHARIVGDIARIGVHQLRLRAASGVATYTLKP
jgi:hypothetical protein